MNKKLPVIICLGTGIAQLPLIIAAKQQKIAVLGIDQNPNSDGVRYLDKFINISTYNTSEVLMKLDQLCADYRYLGIIARASGPALITAEKIAVKYNLLGLREDISKLAIQKSELRKFCEINDIPVSIGWVVTKASPVQLYKNPMIVKPDLPLVGKKEVRLVSKPHIMQEAIIMACESSGNGKAEVEEYIHGFDVSCLFHANNGKAEIITYWDELVGINQDNTIKGLGVSVPSVIVGTEVEIKINRLVNKFASLFKEINTLLILCLRIDRNNNVFVIELHADYGGDFIAEKLFQKADPNFKYFNNIICLSSNKNMKISRKIPQFKATSILYKYINNKRSVILSQSDSLESNLKKIFKTIEKDNLLQVPHHYEWYLNNI